MHQLVDPLGIACGQDGKSAAPALAFSASAVNWRHRIVIPILVITLLLHAKAVSVLTQGHFLGAA